MFSKKHKLLSDILGSLILGFLIIGIVSYLFPNKASAWFSEDWLYESLTRL